MRYVFLAGVLIGLPAPAGVTAVTINIDYSFDNRSEPFFDSVEKKDALEAAVGFFENLLVDDLAPIVPGGGNSWTASFFGPFSGNPAESVANLAVPADTLIVFVGSRDLDGNELGQGLSGSFNVKGTPSFRAAGGQRGEEDAKGLGATDFGVWGGSLAFDSTDRDGMPRKWNFNVETGPAEDEADLLSVALHEMAHLLGFGGFGTALSWRTSTAGHTFTGPASVAEFGGPVGLDVDHGIINFHWAEGTTSHRYPGGETQVAAMAPGPPVGQRRLFTDLDVAALDDIGWDVAPIGDGAPGPQLLAGDANQDLDFNQLDLIQVLRARKYLTGQPATWGEGDWNGAPGGQVGDPPAGDGLFDSLDVIGALRAGTWLTGPYASIRPNGLRNDGQTSVFYHAGTGELAVDAPAGTELTSIDIVSAGGIFTSRPAAFLGGSFDHGADNKIFKATFGGSFGSLSFGSVAPAGLGADFLANDLSVVGSLLGGEGLGAVDLVYVPEPSTVAMLMVGILLLPCRHKRS